MKKALIVGICGFVGSHLACHLIDEGLTVEGLDIIQNTLNERLKGLIADKKVKVHRGSLTDFDFSKLSKYDYIYQLAGKVSAWGDLKEFNKINVDGTKRVIDFAKSIGSKVLVYLSSTAVYGYYGYTDLKEDAPKRPMNNPYPLSKLAAEEMTKSYSKQIGQNYVVIRPGNVYGEYDMTSSYDIYKLVFKGKMPVIDKGKYKSCFVYVKNLVKGIYQASVTPEAYNEDYNLTDGCGETLREYLTHAAKGLGVKPSFISVPAPISKLTATTIEGVYKLLKIKSMPLITMFSVLQNCSDYHFSIEKAKSAFGYNPEISLEEGTKRTADWFKTMPQDIKVKR
ncbi:MAG: NAD(P)-dependent oxidoreductase [Bacillota bacterium]|jgi:nucleoside-diphosphate-sugar epimerase|nr:NAD(P)-dependent oxidoreductase [Bacillota bacterium]HHU43665.1 NAD(P)-dependent oxidoreductase [Clostridiales bacterium]